MGWAVPFGLCLGWILALIAAGFGLQFLSVGVVFWRAWPWGRILGKPPAQCGIKSPHYATGTRAKHRARDDQKDDNGRLITQA